MYHYLSLIRKGDTMLLIIIGGFVFTFLTILGIGFIFISKKTKVERYEKFLGKGKNLADRKDEKSKSLITSYIRKKSEEKKYERKKSNTEILLMNANSSLTIEEFHIIRMILILTTSIISYYLSDNRILIIVFTVSIWYVPIIFLKRIKKKRLKKFQDQLGDAINMLSNSLRAGYSYLQSINTVAKDMPDPIGKEFKILLKEMSLGVKSEKALDNLHDRVSSEDLSLMITAIKIQQETGGNLAEILSNISRTIRERIEIQGEIKTLTAQGRISGLVLGLLPVALIGILMMMNRDYIGVLFTTTIGRGILIYATISELVGAFFINKIIDIDI
jgi:tight adherence protein B